MLKIRLKRMGKIHQPFYRIVVIEHTRPVTGKYIEKLGHYNPFTKVIVVDKKLVLSWLDKGAKPSNTVAKLLQKQDIKHKLIVIKKFRVKSKKELDQEKTKKEAEKLKDQTQKESKKIEFEAQVDQKKEEQKIKVKNNVDAHKEVTTPEEIKDKNQTETIKVDQKSD